MFVQQNRGGKKEGSLTFVACCHLGLGNTHPISSFRLIDEQKYRPNLRVVLRYIKLGGVNFVNFEMVACFCNVYIAKRKQLRCQLSSLYDGFRRRVEGCETES